MYQNKKIYEKFQKFKTRLIFLFEKFEKSINYFFYLQG